MSEDPGGIFACKHSVDESNLPLLKFKLFLLLLALLALFGLFTSAVYRLLPLL